MAARKKVARPKSEISEKAAPESQPVPVRRSARISKAEENSPQVQTIKKPRICRPKKKQPPKKPVDEDDGNYSEELAGDSDEVNLSKPSRNINNDNQKSPHTAVKKENEETVDVQILTKTHSVNKLKTKPGAENEDKYSEWEACENTKDATSSSVAEINGKSTRPARKRSIRMTLPKHVSSTSSSDSESEASDFVETLAESSNILAETDSEDSPVQSSESESAESDGALYIPQKKARRPSGPTTSKTRNPQVKSRAGTSKAVPLPKTAAKKMSKPWQKTASTKIGDIVLPPRELSRGEKKMLHFSRFAGRLAQGRGIEMSLEEATEIVNKMKAGLHVQHAPQELKEPDKAKDSYDSSSSDEDDWMEMEPVEAAVASKDIEITLGQEKGTDKDWWATYLRQEVNKKIRQTWENTHKVHILCYIAHLQHHLKTTLHDHVIPSLLLTQLPGEIANTDIPISISKMKKIGVWFISHYKLSSVDVNVDESTLNGYPYKETARLATLVGKNVHQTDCERSLLLFATFVGLGCISRICVNTITIPRKWYEGMQRDIKETKTKSFSSTIKKEEVAPINHEQNYWIEVWEPKEKRWICINPSNGSVDKPYELEKICHAPISYVLAIDNKKGVRDVSARYSSEFMRPEFRRRRTLQSWLSGTLLRKSLCADKERASLEDVHFRKELLNRPLPTTMFEYKKHPLYVLERDLLKFEAIYPRPDEQKPLGEIRGHKVYPRDCVYTIHGEKNWERMARSVKKDAEPYKIVKAHPNPMLPPEQRVIKDLNLYGFWQTEPFRRLTVENGIIPKNEFGNVYMYQPSMCPIGSVHLKLPGLPQVARRLKRECVPAVVGWEVNNYLPIIEGACVLEEDADLFAEEWKKTEVSKIERAEQKRLDRIHGNWRKLIRGILRLHYVTSKFAPVGGEKKFKKTVKRGTKQNKEPSVTDSDRDKNTSADSGIIDMTEETGAQTAGLSLDDLHRL